MAWASSTLESTFLSLVQEEMPRARTTDYQITVSSQSQV